MVIYTFERVIIMNIETLQYFQYISKYKNITRAAKHFYISQSTLSRHIIALEAELDVKLFIRNNKQIELTEAGKVFSKECKLFIRHMESIIANVQSVSKGGSGMLKITSPGKLSQTLSDSLTLIQKKYPSIKLFVESYDFNEIPCAIQYGLYDIGFTYNFASSDYEELEVIPIGTDTFSLVIPSNHFTDPAKNSIADIVNSLPLILPSYTEPPFMKLIIHELQKFTGIKKVNTTYVNTTDSVMLEISLGLGYSIVPTSLTKSKNNTENISYINLPDFSPKGTIVMLYKKSNPSELLKSFVDIINHLCTDKTSASMNESSKP